MHHRETTTQHKANDIRNTDWMLLSFQLARHNKELQAMLKPGGTYGEGDEALEFYAKHTAQIEVSGWSRSTSDQLVHGVNPEVLIGHFWKFVFFYLYFILVVIWAMLQLLE